MKEKKILEHVLVNLSVAASLGIAAAQTPPEGSPEQPQQQSGAPTAEPLVPTTDEDVDGERQDAQPSPPPAHPIPVEPVSSVPDTGNAQHEPSTGDTAFDYASMDLAELLNMEITTASKSAERATEAPGMVYVITKEDIRLRGYSTLGDVLKDLPGMETSEYYYSEQGTLVPVRGVVGNNKLLLLVNGMRVNPPGGEELMIRHDVSVRFADRVEVVYGPGSTLYGQDAISAVINIITQQPDESLRTLDAVGAYGLHNTIDAGASFGFKLRKDTDSPITVTGYATLRRSDLSDPAEQIPEWWANFQAQMATFEGRSADDKAVRHDLGYNLFGRIESDTASMQAWFRESSRSSSEGAGEGGNVPVLYFIDEAVWRDRSLVVEGAHKLQLTDALALYSALTFNRYEVDPDSRYVFPVPPGLYLDDFKYGISSGVSLEERFQYDIADRSRATVGFNFWHFDILPKVSVLGGADPDGDIVSQAGEIIYFTEQGNPDTEQRINRAIDLVYTQVGAYAEVSHGFTDHLRGVAGVRVDVNSRYSQVPVSPRAALTYNGIDERLTLKYIFSMAYVQPAPFFAHNVWDNGWQISGGNQSLSPERAMSNELNISWTDRNLIGGVSTYFNRLSNLLVPSHSELPQTIVAEAVYLPNGDSRRLAQSINLGSSQSYGLDLYGRFSMGIVSAWGSYSYVDYTQTFNGQEAGLQQLSRHNVRLGVTVKPLPSVSITPSLVLRSTPENLRETYNDVGISVETPHEINLNVMYSPLDELDIFATVRNVTNHHYAVRGSAGPAPQEPLSGFAGARFRY